MYCAESNLKPLIDVTAISCSEMLPRTQHSKADATHPKDLNQVVAEKEMCFSSIC